MLQEQYWYWLSKVEEVGVSRAPGYCRLLAVRREYIVQMKVN